MIEEHAEKEVIAAKWLPYFCLTVPGRALGRNSYEDFGLEAGDRDDRPDVPEYAPTHFEEPAQPPTRGKPWPN